MSTEKVDPKEENESNETKEEKMSGKTNSNSYSIDEESTAMKKNEEFNTSSGDESEKSSGIETTIHSLENDKKRPRDDSNGISRSKFLSNYVDKKTSLSDEYDESKVWNC
jgi:hypothetical protein